MVTLYDNDIVFSEHVRFLKNKENVIIINGCSGIWGLIDSSMLDKINLCITNKVAPIIYIDNLENEMDKQQLKEIFQVLIEEKMIKKFHEEEFEIAIKNVEFKLTNKCNLKCLHCAASCDMSKEDVLSTEQIKVILDKIFKLNIDTLLLTGGEPLIRQDIKLLLPYIRQNFNGTVNMITNGVLIDKEMALILKKYVNAISISIDGYDEKSTEFVRGKGVYNKIVQAVKYLKEAGFDKNTINFTMTAINQNLNHDADFYALCESLDVTGGIRQFSAMGRGLENYENIGVKDYFMFSSMTNEEVEAIRESLECKIVCKAGISKISINELGDMYPCLLLGNEEYKFGNIINEELKDIFDSDRYHRFINNKIRKSVVDNTCKCKECNVRYFCMDACLGVNNAFYSNKEICEERCKQIRPYLTKVLWDD